MKSDTENTTKKGTLKVKLPVEKKDSKTRVAKRRTSKVSRSKTPSMTAEIKRLQQRNAQYEGIIDTLKSEIESLQFSPSKNNKDKVFKTYYKDLNEQLFISHTMLAVEAMEKIDEERRDVLVDAAVNQGDLNFNGSQINEFKKLTRKVVKTMSILQ